MIITLVDPSGAKCPGATVTASGVDGIVTTGVADAAGSVCIDGPADVWVSGGPDDFPSSLTVDGLPTSPSSITFPSNAATCGTNPRGCGNGGAVAVAAHHACPVQPSPSAAPTVSASPSTGASPSSSPPPGAVTCWVGAPMPAACNDAIGYLAYAIDNCLVAGGTLSFAGPGLLTLVPFCLPGITLNATLNATASTWTIAGPGYGATAPAGPGGSLPSDSTWTYMSLSGSMPPSSVVCASTIALLPCGPSASPAPTSAPVTVSYFATGGSCANPATAIVSATQSGGMCSGTSFGVGYDMIVCPPAGGDVVIYKNFSTPDCRGPYTMLGRMPAGACLPIPQLGTGGAGGGGQDADVNNGFFVFTRTDFSADGCGGNSTLRTGVGALCTAGSQQVCINGDTVYSARFSASDCSGYSLTPSVEYAVGTCYPRLGGGSTRYTCTPSGDVQLSVSCDGNPCGAMCTQCSGGVCAVCMAGWFPAANGSCVPLPSVSPTQSPSASLSLGASPSPARNAYGCFGACTGCYYYNENSTYCYACLVPYAPQDGVCVWAGTPSQSPPLSPGASPSHTATPTLSSSRSPSPTPQSGCFLAGCVGCTNGCAYDRTCYSCDDGWVPQAKADLSVMRSMSCTGSLCIAAANPLAHSGAYRTCLAVDSAGYCTTCAPGADCSVVAPQSPPPTPSRGSSPTATATASSTPHSGVCADSGCVGCSRGRNGTCAIDSTCQA